MKLSVVVPLYNEVENVGSLVAAISACARSFGIRVRADRRGRRFQGWHARSARSPCGNPIRDLRVVELRRNYGQTAAMSAGMEHATGEVIVTIDGDLQNDPADIPALVAKIDEGYDLVHGWRKDRKDPWLSRNFLRCLPTN